MTPERQYDAVERVCAFSAPAPTGICVTGEPLMRRCRACERQSDDLYEINGWVICFSCVRTRHFWEMLRDSWTADATPAVSAPPPAAPV